MHSNDDGLHWSLPVAVDLGPWTGTLMGPGNGILLGRHSASVSSGRLMMCGASGYVGNMKMRALIWFSDDHGATWVQSNTSDAFMGMEECQLVELSNGTVVINMRNENKQVRIVSL